jgi:SAM-dependent methyltransferase
MHRRPASGQPSVSIAAIGQDDDARRATFAIAMIRALALAACLALAGPAPAQLEALNQPQPSGGKDVMWVPTPDAAVDRMLAMAGTGTRDLVYDLRSGDGKIAIMAAKRFGARAVGVEFDGEMIEQSRAAARKEGVTDRVRFVQADIFAYDFGEATVVTLYLLSTLNLKLRPQILAMRPGTRVASHMFRMGDWQPDESARVGSSDVYLWVVPARVAGTWALTQTPAGAAELVLDQQFQRISGSMRIAGEILPLAQASLRGDEIRFAVPGEGGARLAFVGRVAGDRIVGEGAAQPWTAIRVRGR